MYFVSGITGRVGGATARQLLQDGHKVRALVRDPAKAANWTQRGVDVRRGDFNDAATIADALKGVDGAYLMLPPNMAPGPGFPETKAMIASFREALRQAPPPRLVVLSSIGAEKSTRLGLITSTHLLEESLGDLPFPTAFVRAGGFFENYAYVLRAGAATGRFDTFLTPTDRPRALIATTDVGKEVARLLVSRQWSGGKKIVELGSKYSPDQLAHAVSEVLGQPVRAHSIPREQWTASLEAHGMPRGLGSALFEEMEEGVNSGWIDFGVQGTEPVAGTITPIQFFTQLKAATATTTTITTGAPAKQ